MRRAALRIFVPLAVGAIVSVGVAWTCALRSPISTGLSRQGMARGLHGSVEAVWWPDTEPRPAAMIIDHTPPQWLVETGDEAYLGLWIGKGFGVQCGLIEANAYPHRFVLHYAAGWPLPALQCHAVIRQPGVRYPGRLGATTVAWQGGARVPRSLVEYLDPNPWPPLTHDRPLPLRPVWPGALVNSVVMAAPIWMVMLLPWGLRARARLRRGLCPSCRYPIGVSDVCTECGVPVRAKGAAA